MFYKNEKIKEIFFQTFLGILLSSFSVITIYPFLNVVARSLSTGSELAGRTIGIIPVKFTMENYGIIFSNNILKNALFITLLRTVIQTICHLTVVALAAYACSDKSLKGRRFIMIFFLVPMYFGGGLIPYYNLINSLGLRNKFLVYIVPGLFATMHFLIMLTYFRSLPQSYKESVKIDGGSEITIFARIIIPISAPIIATVGLFNAVGQWNSYFDTVMFVSNIKLYTLQPILLSILKEKQIEALIEMTNNNLRSSERATITQESVRMATMCFTIIPIICVYPFLQKYFMKGIMLGGIKG